jgi:hypothetical protein
MLKQKQVPILCMGTRSMVFDHLICVLSSSSSLCADLRERARDTTVTITTSAMIAAEIVKASIIIFLPHVTFYS